MSYSNPNSDSDVIDIPDNKSHQPFLYLRLSAYYFFFLAALGAFVPYWPPYLKSLNFTPVEIGELMAIVLLTKLIAPYFLGWLADRFHRRLVIIQVSTFLSAIAFAGVFIDSSYWGLVIIMGIFGFFWNSSLPLFEALTLNHLGDDTHQYSRIRLWGSVGFIVMVAGLPMIIDSYDISILPVILIVLLLVNGLTSLLVKDKQNTEKAKTNTELRLIELLKKPMVIALLASCALQSMSHGAYYTFISIYLDDHHYSGTVIGYMWALGVIAEIVLFLFAYKLLHRFGIYRLYTIALLITSLRWVILALWVDTFAALIFAQLLHAASFGLFHVTAISLTHLLFPGQMQGRGQALYAGLSFGLGGALGSWLSGNTWESFGSTWTFLASATIALLGAMIAARFIQKNYLPDYVQITHEHRPNKAKNSD
ncbi:MAG TPA: MFS transporter [Leucothrix sp.]|nr:MFS transporter [Leucothrix sp.]